MSSCLLADHQSLQGPGLPSLRLSHLIGPDQDLFIPKSHQLEGWVARLSHLPACLVPPSLALPGLGHMWTSMEAGEGVSSPLGGWGARGRPSSAGWLLRVMMTGSSITLMLLHCIRS